PFTWVRVTWNEFVAVRPADRSIASRPHSVESETDQHGAATFCGVPARTMLPIYVLRGVEKRPVFADSVRLNDRTIVARDVRVP
ncbi:MAG: hypothetical protein ACRD2A_25850, partial [Vicinamibacterales bacterium]